VNVLVPGLLVWMFFSIPRRSVSHRLHSRRSVLLHSRPPCRRHVAWCSVGVLGASRGGEGADSSSTVSDGRRDATDGNSRIAEGLRCIQLDDVDTVDRLASASRGVVLKGLFINANKTDTLPMPHELLLVAYSTQWCPLRESVQTEHTGVALPVLKLCSTSRRPRILAHLRRVRLADPLDAGKSPAADRARLG